MGRSPVRGSPVDSYCILLEVQTTIDEYIYDSESYAKGCMYTLRKISRWGRDMGVPVMVAADRDTLSRMPADHRQLNWYFTDITQKVEWGTAKKHRSAVANYYERMGVPVDEVPTSTTRFTHRMNGLAQRKGVQVTQALVFSDILLKDMTALLLSDFSRARGEQKVVLAQANLAWHAYNQTGSRANELFEQRVGMLEDTFCYGSAAARKKLMPHLKFRAKLQTKTERFTVTDIWCCARTKRAPFRTLAWARITLVELRKAGRGGRENLVWGTDEGQRWKMGAFWQYHILPRFEQLKRERLGGLEDTDLGEFTTNSFRRTWNTLAGEHPDPVSVDLRERQGRWRKHARSSVLASMTSLYFDPRPNELLLATYWL
jgi:hypothetical protein